MVSPKKFGTKYSPLSRYFLRRAQYTSHITLSFGEIEGIISDNLPFGAVRNRGWWTNTSRTGQGQAWLNVGWKVQDIDLNKRTVTLARVKSVETKPRRRKKRKKSATTFELPVKPRLRRDPSLTKIAKIQGRAKNIERQRSSLKRYKGRIFRMKNRRRNKLWDETAKPTKN